MCAKQDIVIEYMYPRLDAEVSKHLNHLLKSPFCVHPGTGRVCVPIPPDKIDTFDPFSVPTLGQLIQELDDSHFSQGSKGFNIKESVLWPYIDYFKKFSATMMTDELAADKETVNLDF